MTRAQTTFRLAVTLAIVLSLAAGTTASAKDTSYQTGLETWRGSSGDFAGWTTDGGVSLVDGSFVLNEHAQPASDPYAPGTYYGGNYYNGGPFVVGEATSPVVLSTFAFREAIASWNAETPDGTWIETQARARIGTGWTKWYSLGIWASGDDTIQRHSVRLQGDADGYVAVDTLVVTNKTAANALQLKVRLFSETADASPSVGFMAVATSTTATKPKAKELAPGNPALWNTLLDVPECSQMVYPDGGEVWCSPTSTSMVLGYYGFMPGACEARVRDAVEGVYDWIYDGHGNWPFNTAYAAAQGYEAYVARFTSMAQVEPWVAAGVPVVFSFAWSKNDLDGAAIPSSNGHLAVIVGFDAAGNPIVNDPAAASDEDVQRTYDRTQLESLWLEHSGGTVYLIYPQGTAVPAS